MPASNITKAAKKITLRYTLFGVGTGLIPILILNAFVLLGVQVFLVRHLSKIYGVQFKKERVRSFISILVANLAAVGLFKFVPGLGVFFGGSSAAAIGAAATYALGTVYTQHFEEKETLLDFDPEPSKAFFKSLFEKGKKVVADLKNQMTNKE